MHSSLNTPFTYNGIKWAANTDQEGVALCDNFLSKVVPEIEASKAFKDNGVIVIWNDETEGDEGVGSTAGFRARRLSSRRSPRATPTRTTSITRMRPICARGRMFSASWAQVILAARPMRPT
jgi:hypothetical protein